MSGNDENPSKLPLNGSSSKRGLPFVTGRRQTYPVAIMLQLNSKMPLFCAALQSPCERCLVGKNPL